MTVYHDVEQNSDAWLKLRAGVPTASEFSRILTPGGIESKSMEGYARELAGEMYAGRPLDTWDGNKYTARGHELEDAAAATYEFVTGFAAEPCGFVTRAGVGCSPDRLVCGDGLLEIKCFPKRHVEVLLFYLGNDRLPDEFKPQVQGQLLVTGRQWCDMMFYQPGLPPLIVRVEPDLEYIDKLNLAIEKTIARRNNILAVLESM